MNTFQCPFCYCTIPQTNDTHYVSNTSFFNTSVSPCSYDSNYRLMIEFYKCPYCDNISSVVHYNGTKLPQKTIPIYPQSFAKQFPEYIPEAIRNDYEEACNILTASPKASATLSRRCLQGIIRDYWKVSCATLSKEIDALKEKIDPELWKAIDAFRKIGNIGAHMEKDVNTIVDIEPDEADKLIKLIELLMKEWYITSHERQQLLGDIVTINDEKQASRKGKE